MRKPLVAAALLFALLGSGVAAPANAAEPDLFDAGDGPVRVVFSPDGARFYVADYDGQAVSGYLSSTRAPLFTVPVGGSPLDIDVSPDGRTIAVGIEGGVTMVDALTGTVSGADSGSTVSDVEYSPDGSRLYVVNGGQLHRRDPRTGAYLNVVSTPDYPAVGVAFDASGAHLYVQIGEWGSLYRMRVADEFFNAQYGWGSYGGAPSLTLDGTRAIIATAGALMVVDMVGPNEPRMITGVDAGSPFVTNPWGTRTYVANGNDIAVIDVGSEQVIDTITPVSRPSGLAISPSGTELWVAMRGTDQVQVIPIPKTVLGSDVEVQRVAGANRYETAIEISEQFEGPVSTVFIASGEKFPDALGAAPAAIAEGGVLLLTPKTFLPSSVGDRIRELAPERIVFIGSDASLDATVRAAVRAAAPAATVLELSGADRFDTSRKILTEFFPERNSVFVATGLNFPDALAAGPVAGLAGQGILLVNGSASTTDQATDDVLSTPQAAHVVLVGGIPSISEGVAYGIYAKTPASNDLRRIFGSDRFNTAQNLNGRSFDAADVAYLASGLNFPDALAGAVLAGHDAAPLYVVPPNCVPQRVIEDLARLGVSRVVVLGSSASLGAGVTSMTACS